MLSDQITDPGVARFVAARCTVGVTQTVPVRELFDAWTAWAGENDTWPGSINVFAHQLRRAVPGAAVYRPRNSAAGQKVRHYRGISLA